MARSKAYIPENLNAFLDSLAWCEGTNTSTITMDDGYDIIVTGVDGKERFSDYSRHPFENRKPKQVNNSGLFSTASGRYQFMRVHWPHYRDLLKLPDFGPMAQDAWAIQLLKETPAYKLILAGKIVEAVAACRHLWASLPGAGYGQREHTIDEFLRQYAKYGGKLWNTSTESLEPSLPLPAPTLPESLSEPVKLNPMPAQVEQPKTQTGFLNLLLRLLGRK